MPSVLSRKNWRRKKTDGGGEKNMNGKNARWTAIAVCTLFITMTFFGMTNIQSQQDTIVQKDSTVQLKKDGTATITCEESIRNTGSSLQNTIILYPIQDSLVAYSGHPLNFNICHENFGSAQNLVVRSGAAPKGILPEWRRSFIQFDLSSIPVPRSQVTSAILRLYRFDTGVYGPPQDMEIHHHVYEVKRQWDEDTITWVKQPNYYRYGFSACCLIKRDIHDDGWKEWDVTASVRGTRCYYGWIIRHWVLQPGPRNVVKHFTFYSKESWYPGGEDLRPQLVVTYSTVNNPPNTPSQPEGPTSGNVGESLRYESYFSDPDGDSMDVLFDWGDGTDTGWIGVVASGTTVGNYHSWSSPGAYQVRTKARDIPYHAESDWSPSLTVTIS